MPLPGLLTGGGGDDGVAADVAVRATDAVVRLRSVRRGNGSGGCARCDCGDGLGVVALQRAAVVVVGAVRAVDPCDASAGWHGLRCAAMLLLWVWSRGSVGMSGLGD